jgi:hypothetical protein
MIKWPPSAHADDVRKFAEVADRIQHISHRYRGMSVIGVLLSLDREYQTRVLKERDGAVVARIIRQKIHVSSSSRSVHVERLQSTPDEVLLPGHGLNRLSTQG